MHAMHSSSSRGAPMTKKQQWRRVHSRASSSLPSMFPSTSAFHDWNCSAHQTKSSGALPPATPPLSPSLSLSPPLGSPLHLRYRSSKGTDAGRRPEEEAGAIADSRRSMRRVASMDTLSSPTASPAPFSSSWRHTPHGAGSAVARSDREAGAGRRGVGADCGRQAGGVPPRLSSVVGSPTGETARTGEMQSRSRGEETMPSRTTTKNVRFNHCVRMVLVPCRRDLDAVTVRRVWWGEEELAQFRFAAAELFLKERKEMEMVTAAPQKSSSGSTAGSVPSSEDLLRHDREESCQPDAAGPVAMAALPVAVQCA